MQYKRRGWRKKELFRSIVILRFIYFFLKLTNNGISFFFRHIRITPTPNVGTMRTVMRSVAGSLGPFSYQIGRYSFAMVSPPDGGEQIDEGGWHVQSVMGKFRIFVVPRENMMVIVPTVTERCRRNEQVFSRIDIPVGNVKEKSNNNNNNGIIDGFRTFRDLF